MSSKRFSMTRFGRIAALTLCLPVGLSSLLAGSAAAAGAPGGEVQPGDLPSATQTASIYPFLEGGSREVNRNRQLAVRTADCLAWENGPRAASGRWAYYLLADGSMPYFAGYDDPSVFVYKFDSLAGARAAMGDEQSSIRHCEGSATDDDGYRVTSHEVDVPRLGGARIAHREVVRQPASSGSDRDYFLSVWVREGRYLVEARAQKDAGPARKDRVVSLARTTLATIG
jgi:hypothetical protein